MELPDVTLDWLRAWWASHPDEQALIGNACHCIVAEPVAQVTGLPTSYVPGLSIDIWPEGTVVEEMVTPRTRRIASSEVDDTVSSLAKAFDGREGTSMSGAEIVNLIDERSGK